MTPGTAPEGAAETITERELEEYFQRRQSERNIMGGASLEAARIVRDIKAHREPEYEPGEIYLSENGYRYMRLADSQWLVLYERGETGVRPERQPLRPLRKMVPLPSREDVLAALEEDISREHGYDGQANRIFKLLEGGSGD